MIPTHLSLRGKKEPTSFSSPVSILPLRKTKLKECHFISNADNFLYYSAMEFCPTLSSLPPFQRRILDIYVTQRYTKLFFPKQMGKLLTIHTCPKGNQQNHLCFQQHPLPTLQVPPHQVLGFIVFRTWVQ